MIAAVPFPEFAPPLPVAAAPGKETPSPALEFTTGQAFTALLEALSGASPAPPAAAATGRPALTPPEDARRPAGLPQAAPPEEEAELAPQAGAGSLPVAVLQNTELPLFAPRGEADAVENLVQARLTTQGHPGLEGVHESVGGPNRMPQDGPTVLVPAWGRQFSLPPGLVDRFVPPFRSPFLRPLALEFAGWSRPAGDAPAQPPLQATPSGSVPPSPPGAELAVAPRLNVPSPDAGAEELLAAPELEVRAAGRPAPAETPFQAPSEVSAALPRSPVAEAVHEAVPPLQGLVRHIRTADGPGTQPTPAQPVGELTFVARLSETSPDRGAKELLAALAAPELKVRATGRAAPAETQLQAGREAPPMRPGQAQPVVKLPPIAGEPPAWRAPDAAGASRTEAVAPPSPANRPELLRPETFLERPYGPGVAFRGAPLFSPPAAAYPGTAPPVLGPAPESSPAPLDTRTLLNGPAEVSSPLPEARPAPLRELSLVVPARASEGQPQGGVEVRVVERAGEVAVAVHTRDRELADSLREQLPELVQRLERVGYHTQTWRPAGAAAGSAAEQGLPGGRDHSSAGHGSHHEAGRDHARQHEQRQQEQPQWIRSLAAAGFGGFSEVQDMLRSS